MEDKVREPIQTYLTGEERAALDRVARDLGVSRSEALRRGIQALGAGVGEGGGRGPLSELVAEGSVTLPGEPLAVPEVPPVALLAEVLEELRRDRDYR